MISFLRNGEGKLLLFKFYNFREVGIDPQVTRELSPLIEDGDVAEDVDKFTDASIFYFVLGLLI